VKIKNVFVPLLIANENIAPNSPLGFAYGKDYWLISGKQPRYFYADGALIPLSAYRNTFYNRAGSPLPLLSGIIQPDPRVYYDSALALYKKGQFSQAIEKLLRAVEGYQQKKKELATCYDTLASCYRDNKENAKAVVACQKAIELRTELLVIDVSIQAALDKSILKLHALQEYEPSTSTAKIT
jgi:tetratricopeptide (TPR) repeat protein